MGNKPKLLYVEDDLALSFVTRDNLEIRGYQVDHAGDGIAALEMMQNSEYDLCILDVMLPKMDGFTLAARIRAVNQGIPILFLTARSAREDRISGLTLGGDDYITKPFSMEELVLKIEVFLKRKNIVPMTDPMPVRLGEFTYDYRNQQLSYGEKPRFLTQKENELLAFLIENKGRILKREEILRKVWGNDDIYFSRSLDVFVSRLRKVLKPDPKIVIETIHNTGYRLKAG